MYILGIYNGHNASAALLKDGKVMASISEERFTNKKNFSGFPKNSIDYLLKDQGITGKDIDYVTIPALYGAPIHSSEGTKKTPIVAIFNVLYIPLNVIRKIWGRVVLVFPWLRPIGIYFYNLAAKTVGKITVEKEKELYSNYLSLDKSRVVAFDHHLSHAASSYYASPFNQEKTLVCTLDGEGDTLCSSIWIMEGEKRERIARSDRTNSIGLLYSNLTIFYGMKSNEHEYKVMGLAPYAKHYGINVVFEEIKDWITVDKETLEFKSKFDMHLALPILRKKMRSFRFDNIAGAFQKLVEDRIVEWIEAAIKKTGISTVALSGGVFMNVKANLRVTEIPGVKKMFVIPSCGDESTPIGASYLAYSEACQKKNKKPLFEPIKEIYWGPSYSNEYIQKFLKEKKFTEKYKVEFHEQIEEKVAELLSQNHIVARLAGKMEFGARALGNRSILANPKDPETVRIINEQMKNRDFWMPFTPSIRKEREDDYIINPKHVAAPYMMITFHSTEKAQKDLKAAMHPYDFTVRPQVVEESWNPRYHRLITAFEKLTGIGGVLNTSFNLHGYPMIMDPEQALYAFENSGLKFLALENYLVSKR